MSTAWSWGWSRSSPVRWGPKRPASARSFASCWPIIASTRASTASQSTGGMVGPPEITGNPPRSGGGPWGPLIPSFSMTQEAPERLFLERNGLSQGTLERVLGTLARRADWADCYFEHRVSQTASLEDGVVKKATRGMRQGVGVRVVANTRTGYAYSDEVTLERLELAARTARYIADERATTATVPVVSPPRGPH